MKPVAKTTPPGTARQEVARRLGAAGSMVVVAHDRPDGDAVGSMVALALAARTQGKTVHLIGENLPRGHAFLAEGQTLQPADRFAGLARASDCVVVLDTCAIGQLQSIAGVLGATRDKTLVIDHHPRGEDIAPLRWCDESAAAAGVMVAELLADLGWPMDLRVAGAVMAAVCFDTGWLRFANTDGRALAVVGRCLRAGVAVDELYRRLYQNDRPERLALLGRILTGMQLHFQGRVALLTAGQEDFARTGAGLDETENLVNEPLRIGGVCVSVLLVEQEACIRGSLRSKAHVDPASSGRVVDVAAIARSLGGGGHTRAAGFRMSGAVDEVRQKVLAALGAEFD